MSARGAAPNCRRARRTVRRRRQLALSSSLDALLARPISPPTRTRAARLAVRDGLVGSRRALRASSAGARVAPPSPPSRRRDGFRAPRSRRRFVLVVRLLSSASSSSHPGRGPRVVRAPRARGRDPRAAPPRLGARRGMVQRRPRLWRRVRGRRGRGVRREGRRGGVRLRHEGSRGGRADSSRTSSCPGPEPSPMLDAIILAFVLAAATCAYSTWTPRRRAV